MPNGYTHLGLGVDHLHKTQWVASIGGRQLVTDRLGSEHDGLVCRVHSRVGDASSQLAKRHSGQQSKDQQLHCTREHGFFGVTGPSGPVQCCVLSRQPILKRSSDQISLS